MRTSFRHQSEAQPPNGPLTAATSPDTPSTCPAGQSGLHRLKNGTAPRDRLVRERADAGNVDVRRPNPARRRAVSEFKEIVQDRHDVSAYLNYRLSLRSYVTSYRGPVVNRPREGSNHFIYCRHGLFWNGA
jgi:hypothetical protein